MSFNIQQLLDFALTSRLHLTRNPITSVISLTFLALLMKVYKFCSYILKCRREPYCELDEQCEGEDGFDEAPYVLEGSGLTTAPVDGMGSRTRGNEDERLNTNS